MRVRIEQVETTVVQTTQEIAQVSREAAQGIQIKPEPSIEWMGTVKGKIETPIDISSNVKTTVTEKLLKELDRRSTWLNPDRNLLLITERGMEAANIQGSFKEIISLRIPKSQSSSINYIDYRDKTVKIRTVDQPLYASIPAVAVSLSVVREPYKLKRSVSEKYGLADSSHARYIVAVAEPAWLRLWNWRRLLTNLDMDDLMDDISVERQPPLSKHTSTRLRFYHQESRAEGVLYVGSEEAQDFITELRKGLLRDLTQTKSESKTPQPPKSQSQSQIPEPPFSVQCKWADAKNKTFYLVLDTKTGTIWIGKEKDEKNEKHMIPFTGKEESKFLGQIKSNNKCTS